MKVQKNKINRMLLAVLALLATYGISYTCSIAATTYFSNGIVSMLVFIGVYALLKKTWSSLENIADKKMLRKRLIYVGIVSYIFAVSLIMGYQLQVRGMTESGFLGKGLILIRGFCLAVGVFPFANLLFAWIEKVENIKASQDSEKKWKRKNIFLLSWIVIFLCWIPAFLAYYPAIMSYDFHRQSQEAVKGFIWFNSYQPLAHTWLIWLFLKIGTALGSYESGMACFSLFQMLVFSASCSYSCVILYRLINKKWPMLLLTGFYALFPFLSVFAVCTTKDTMFSALFLVFICLFIEKTYFCDGRKRKIIEGLWVFEGIIMILFRNNALYAMAVFMIFYILLSGKGQRLRVFVLCMLLIVGGKGALEGVQAALGTEIRGSKIEMLSVPIVQVGRVGYYHGYTLEGETFEMLDRCIPQEYWGEYNPAISDGLKSYLGKVYPAWMENVPQLLSDYIKIGLQYPNEYLDAFLQLTRGYWFIDDVSWAEVLGYGPDGRMGAIYTYTSSTSEVIPDGIAHETKWSAAELFFENIVSANGFYKWPIISNLFKPAFYSWGLFLVVLASIYVRDRKKVLLTLFPLIYLGTMFLGPVVQSRYILPIIVILPLLWGVFCMHNDDKF